MALPASAGATLATTPVPYMGWNTYYQVGSETPGSNNINELTIKSVAQSLVSTGLAKAGYTIVWLDFGWASGARDSNGNLLVDPTQWPDGLSALTAYLHGLGLEAGIYTDAGASGCSGLGVGSYGHYQQDANQFAAWGFDAVKVDFCGAGQQWLDRRLDEPDLGDQEQDQRQRATGCRRAVPGLGRVNRRAVITGRTRRRSAHDGSPGEIQEIR